jgi:hypothetical protein
MARRPCRTDAQWVMRRFTSLLAAAVLAAALAHSALAAGGRYTFAGGTAKQQGAVRSALDASSFDWDVLPVPVVVHIAAIGGSYSEPGHVHLDSALLDAGRFSWGVVQHEFAHQVDFLLFDDATRAAFGRALGGSDWCYGTTGLAHSAYGCERFASELAWAYWPSAESSMSPAATHGESGAMPAAQFRALLAQVLGVPTLATPVTTKAYAPATKKPAKPRPHRP